MSIRSVRGAITTENTKQDIYDDTKILLTTIIEKNNIDFENIVSITFSATKDIDMAYPAVSARELGITDTSLMCLQEMYVKGSLEKCIRVSIIFETEKQQKDVKHIYLKGAEILRPDLRNKI